MWDGKSWVKDEAAEKNAHVLSAKNQVNTLQQTASARVMPLQDAVDLEMATDDEKKNWQPRKNTESYLAGLIPAPRRI